MATTAKSEFTVENAYPYNQASAPRWVFSHIWRYKWLFIMAILLSAVDFFSYSQSSVLIGKAAAEILHPRGGNRLLDLSLGVLGVMTLSSMAFWTGGLLIETLAQRLEADFAPGALHQPAGQEPDVSRPAARRGHHGPRD